MADSRDGYRDLAPSIQRLQSALKIRKLYRSIERIEANYQEPRQREFYRSVAYLLAECPDREIFRDLLREKIEESLNSIVSEKSRIPVFEYFQYIETILDDALGFSLLDSFKNPRSNSLFALTLISDLLDSLEFPEEETERTIAGFVRQHHESLVSLHSILALTEWENSLDTLFKILHYLVLDRRYGLSLDKFEKSIALLGEWYLSYKIVVGIRQEYPSTDYRQPKNFSESIPGIELYQKYENSLTGHSIAS